MTRQRAVITGLGAVTPLGSSVPLLWEGLLAGRSGISRITAFDASELACQIGGQIPDFEATDYMDRKEARRIPRSTQIALACAVQAVADAGLPEIMPDADRAAVVFGTAMGGIDNIIEGVDHMQTRGYGRVNPFTLPSGIPNLSAFYIAQRFQCLGPNSTIVTACATGTQTVGEALELVRRGAADVVICGGTEALMHDYSIAGFTAMRALPVNFNDRPEAASRPFDALREGFLFSEGAAAMVVESLEHAQARQARIYAELVGHASSADAYHIAAPHPEGEGPIRAMRWALQDANVEPQSVSYINAHGSSTPLNDSMETLAIKKVFGEAAYLIPVSSTKSMLGHAMGASGTIEAIACTLAIRDQILPPTINYENPDPECDLDYVPNQARPHPVDVTLSNSFGLGGQNACLVIRRFQE